MAIIKQAKNIIIIVQSNYSLQVGRNLDKVAEIVNIEATEDNLLLFSGKQIIALGNKKKK